MIIGTGSGRHSRASLLNMEAMEAVDNCISLINKHLNLNIDIDSPDLFRELEYLSLADDNKHYADSLAILRKYTRY